MNNSSSNLNNETKEGICRDSNHPALRVKSQVNAADEPEGEIMVANDDGDKKFSRKRIPTISFDSDRINGCTVLHETPIVSRIVVRFDNTSCSGANDSSDLPEDILVSKATKTTLYKCHLCCSICPTLHRMRCHLVFHCRKDALKCSTFNSRSPNHYSDHESTDLKQETDNSISVQSSDRTNDQQCRQKLAEFPNTAAENLTAQKNHSTVNEVKSNVKRECSFSDHPPGLESGASVLVDGNYTRSWSEKTQDTPEMDSEARNSTSSFDLASRKRKFSMNDEYRRNNSRGAEHINEVGVSNGSGKFSTDNSIVVTSKMAQKNYHLDNGKDSNLESSNESKFKSFDKERCERADYTQRLSNGPPPLTDVAHPNGIPADSYDRPSDRCVFSQNGPSLFSPYYWLARQQWFSFAASNRYTEFQQQEESVNRNLIHPNNCSSPKVVSPLNEVENKEKDDIQTSFNGTPMSPRRSPNIVSPTPSPSKSSSPSADSSSSQLAPTSFQLYNPLELVKIMRNFTAYPSLLPPVFPFLPLPSTLQNSSLDSRYANKSAAKFSSKHDHLSDSDEPTHTGAHRSLASAPQIKMPPALSFDKSPPKNFYPYYSLLNFAPSANYNFPPKFIPAPETDSSVDSPRLNSFNQSQYYKPLLSRESNFHNAPLKSWPSPCDTKPTPDPVIRREFKVSPYCKADK